VTSADQRAELLGRLDQLVARRRMPRLERLLSHPFATVANSVAMRAFNLLFSLGRSCQREVETFFGERMTIIVPSWYGEVYCYGATVDADAEVRLNKFLLRELAEGAVFFDVGACLGYFSLLASRIVGPAGRVHTFEPSPFLLPLLRRNVSGKPNVLVVGKATSKASGTTQFHIAPLPFIGTSSLRADWQTGLAADGQTRKTELVTVETVRLDDYCYSAGVFPDVIKLDVEGVEDDVLIGSDRLLRDKAPILVLELFPPLIESDRKALQILRGLGYEPYAIQDDGRLKALGYEALDPYLLELKARYRVIQDSINDFDNMVFKRSATGEGARHLLS
jgi:FkbM family methyltransferase